MAQNRVSGATKRSTHAGDGASGQHDEHIDEESVSKLAAAGKKLAETAGSAVDQAKSEVARQTATLFTRQKDAVTSEFRQITSFVREAAKGVEQDDQLAISGYVNSAVGALDRVEAYLDDATFRSLLNDAETCARRRPAIFYGGLFVAGVAAARFLKAASDANAQSLSAASKAGAGKKKRARAVHAAE